jgi:phospholipase/carboxylesterase
MKELEIGGLTVRLAGGSDRDGGGQGPMVVLMHGFGAPGTDLVPLWRQLAVPRDTRFAFPEAPLTVDVGMPGPEGRAWWMIDVARLQAALLEGETRDLTREVPEGLSAAREKLTALLDELEARFDVRGDRLVLGGFSQGAMLALDVALRSERKLAGLVLMSGTLLAEDEWTPLMVRRSGLPVLQSHGRDDPLLPFSIAEQLRDRLREAGLDVEWTPFSGGHGISDGIVNALGAFVTRVV